MAWDKASYSGLKPDPFIGWLKANGLLQPGSCWSAETSPDGQYVYRRFMDFGPGWPAGRIAGPLVVRPKRKTLEALLP